MGVLSGKDIYSSRYITADITDAAHKVHFVPIKYTLGDFFLADINQKIYLFQIKGDRIFTWEKTLAKSFRKIYYNTSHALPISPEDTHSIETLLKENNLPKIDKNLFKILQMLGLNEELKHGEKPSHSLKKLSESIQEFQGKHPEEVQNMLGFIKNIGEDRVIVTPVRKIGEFIEKDLMETSPGFLGDVIAHHQRTDIEHAKVRNQPYNIKKPWMMIALFMMIIVIGGGVGLYLFNDGAFDDIGIPGFGDTSQEDIMTKYPSPQALEAAIDSGELDFDELPKDIRSMLTQFREGEEAKGVTATPIP